MGEPFKLTMYEAPPDRRPFEVSRDGSTWSGISQPQLAALLERHSPYPDDTRAELDRGAVVRVVSAGVLLYVRRRPSEAARADARRQLGLL